MSDRDKQRKHNRENNIDSSLFSRVNVGQNANNKFDSPKMTHAGGSMHNPDEAEKYTHVSLPRTLLYYSLGVLFSGLIAFLGLKLFQDYFYGAGMNEPFPALILLIFSLTAGFGLSKFVIKKVTNRRIR